jgi:hypothetical protein
MLSVVADRSAVFFTVKGEPRLRAGVFPVSYATTIF